MYDGLKHISMKGFRMFTLAIDTNGSAFDEDMGNAGPELARILELVAERIKDGVPSGDSATLMDVNGNTVGEWNYNTSN